MTKDDETLAFYNSSAREYADRFCRSEDPDQDLKNFADQVHDGGLVLDLGCGPGRSAALLRELGFEVEAWDASEGMVSVAKEMHGLNAKVALFEDLNAEDTFDGVFANFSLLHAPRAEMPNNLKRIKRALKPGGVFHMGLKTGQGEERDKLGRRYSYFSQEELQAMLETAGLSILQTRTFEAKGMTGKMEPAIIMLSRA